MFELPEYLTIADQMNTTLKGKTIHQGQLGNSSHKFVWYNCEPDEFENLTQGKTVGEARTQGRWLLVPLEPGYVLVFGECGGKILYQPPESKPPTKHHLYLTFDDDSSLMALTQMWGAYELYEQGKEQQREYIKDMRPTPVDAAFTFEYFTALIDDLIKEKKRSVKGLLTQEQLIPGLGNAIAQDIMFNARLHPRHNIAELDAAQRRTLFDAIINTVGTITAQGGRYDEYDLYGNPGGYVRLMDKNTVGKPCPECGREVEKISYMGGACYLCPSCQK